MTTDNARMILSTPPSGPIAGTSAEWSGQLPQRLQQAYELLVQANGMDPSTVTTAELLAMIQELAGAVVDVTQGFWVVASHVGARDDLPCTLGMLTSALVNDGQTQYTSLSVTPLSGSITIDDTLLISSEGQQQQVIAASNQVNGDTSIQVQSFTANDNFPAGSLVTDYFVQAPQDQQAAFSMPEPNAPLLHPNEVGTANLPDPQKKGNVKWR